MINLLVCKLYYNFTFGNTRPSVSQFILAKISISLILLFWICVFVKILKKVLDLQISIPLAWLYTLLFFIIFYFLNKKTWRIHETEAFINDKENESILNDAKWLLGASYVIPLLLLLLLK